MFNVVLAIVTLFGGLGALGAYVYFTSQADAAKEAKRKASSEASAPAR